MTPFRVTTLFIFLKAIFFIYLHIGVLGLHCCAGFSLVEASRGYSVAARASQCGSSSCGAWALGQEVQ